MSTQEKVQEVDQVEINAENIGGIERTAVSFSPGVTILAGRNATNRTSLLQAIAAAFGSDQATLKGDADAGSVELELGDETYTRTVERRNGTVVFDGDPYLEDATVADLFAFLFKSNRARRAVERGDDLHDVIMEPVDTAAIEAQIDEYRAERRRLDDQLEELDEKAARLPDLEEQRQTLRDEIEQKKDALAAKEAEIEAVDRDVDATREEKAQLEETLETLQEVRSELEETRYSIESEQESIAALEDDIDTYEEKLASMSETPTEDIEEIEAQLDRLREQRRSLETTIDELRSVIQFNEGVVDGEDVDAGSIDMLDEGDEANTSGGSVTDQLVAESEVVCWTCGSTVAKSAIEETLDRLRSLVQDKQGKRSEIQSQIRELQSEKSSHRETQQEYERLERQIDQAEAERERRQERLEELREDRERLQERVSELEADVEELQDAERSELLELHKEANQLEFELGQREEELESVTAEIEEVEAALDEKDEIQTRREEIRNELESLRTRIERIEREAVEQFNEHMETVLDLLGYENLARVWIERRQTTVQEGRQSVEQSVFELHIIRESDKKTYEDTIEHLSESEREVTGLVFALAGYLTHEVYDEVPFLLIDSLEAIDSERIAALIEYVDDFAGYSVVALLPEDAQAVDDQYQRLSEI